MKEKNFGLLRNLLRAFGLSDEAIDDIVERINEWLGEKEKTDLPTELPYRIKDPLLSPAEQSFYLVLKDVVADKGVIFSKIGLGELFYASTKDQSLYRSLTNKIDRKHMDFVVCDPKTLKPIVAIELDDKSHQRADRKTRDEFVQQVFDSTKFPLVRVPARTAYSTAEILRQLNLFLPGENARSLTEVRISEPSPPKCPTCNSSMVLRTARQGTNQGNQFWGCTNYPRCRGILKYDTTGQTSPGLKSA